MLRCRALDICQQNFKEILVTIFIIQRCDVKTNYSEVAEADYDFSSIKKIFNWYGELSKSMFAD